MNWVTLQGATLAFKKTGLRKLFDFCLSAIFSAAVTIFFVVRDTPEKLRAPHKSQLQVTH